MTLSIAGRAAVSIRAAANGLDQYGLHAGMPLIATFRAVRQRRGKPLVLIATPALGGEAVCSGLTTTRDAKRDIVYYARATTAWHRANIVAHEFAHLFCGTLPGDLCAAEPYASTARLLAQQDLDTEREAEMYATALRTPHLTAAQRDRARELLDAITPLWTLVVEADPSLVLAPEDARIATQLHRRVSEIRDLQLMLTADTHSIPLPRIRQAVDARSASTYEDAVRGEATAMRIAFEAHARGERRRTRTVFTEPPRSEETALLREAAHLARVAGTLEPVRPNAMYASIDKRMSPLVDKLG